MQLGNIPTRRRKPARRHALACALLLPWTLGGVSTAMAAQTIRAICYNIEADIGGYTTPRPGLDVVLEAIGEANGSAAAHPLDLLALEETTSNTATVAPLVTTLNNYYGAGTYAASALQATESGGNPSTGNGPNAMVYNTRTLTLLASVGVGSPKGSTNGEYRQVSRYEFMPVGGAVGTQFYVYVSHMKSSYGGSTPAEQTSRHEEATIITNDIATLPANGGVLCMGDFNLDGSTEAAYQTLTSTSKGLLTDPLNPSDNYNENWSLATYLTLMSESATKIAYRDDIQFMSPPVYNGTSSIGLHYAAGSCVVFGNNGTVKSGTSVNQASNTALNGLQGPVTPAAALSALTNASDHLPVVADYVVVSQTPYSVWQAKYFTAAELAKAAVSGDDADPDGDGIPNLVEYALGLLPRTAGVSGLPVVGTTTISGSKYLTLTYTQVVADTDITYVPQASGDLQTWSAGASAVATVSTTPSMDGLTRTVVVRDLTAATGANARFMRLTVTHP